MYANIQISTCKHITSFGVFFLSLFCSSWGTSISIAYFQIHIYTSTCTFSPHSLTPSLFLAAPLCRLYPPAYTHGGLQARTNRLYRVCLVCVSRSSSFLFLFVCLPAFLLLFCVLLKVFVASVNCCPGSSSSNSAAGVTSASARCFSHLASPVIVSVWTTIRALDASIFLAITRSAVV